MSITYETAEAFYIGIIALTKAGLTFEANGEKLEITLTGGY